MLQANHALLRCTCTEGANQSLHPDVHYFKASRTKLVSSLFEHLILASSRAYPSRCTRLCKTCLRRWGGSLTHLTLRTGSQMVFPFTWSSVVYVCSPPCPSIQADVLLSVHWRVPDAGGEILRLVFSLGCPKCFAGVGGFRWLLFIWPCCLPEPADTWACRDVSQFPASVCLEC